MVIKKYKSIVTSLSNHSEGVYTVEFKSLAGDYRYSPGQFLHLALDSNFDGTGQWPESRCFSMQSNPDEERIRITYAVKGRFTEMMKENLKVNSEVWLKLPYGDLFLRSHNKINTVFIAGGTGITPFLSLFAHKSFTDYINPNIYLGFRSKSLNIYEAELNHSSDLASKISFYYDDINGRLDIKKIRLENGSFCDYFISGPVEMIEKFKSYLIETGVRGENIITDNWG